MASVAILDGPRVVAYAEREARQNASGACLELFDILLEESNTSLDEIRAFGADIGPGSFIGSRVAATLAKTLAFASGVPTFGALSFDLISPDQTVIFPSKKGEWFVRRVGAEAVRQTELPDEPFVGFGPGIEPLVYPSAKGFAALPIEYMKPAALLPHYAIEPSISVPKVPFPQRGR